MAKICYFLCIFLLFQLNCGKPTLTTETASGSISTENQSTAPVSGTDTVLPTPDDRAPLVAAARTSQYLPLLRGKRIGMIVNHTSTIGGTHLVDSLLALGMDVKRIFSPEHGFRGTADAGEKIADGRDPRTGLPLVSLYGSKKEPTPADLADLDVLVFDVQDVGARFYTYIYTMTYAMRAAARAGLPFVVLDRPNPNGNYVDGPVLQPGFESFVGLHPTPIVHGMTVGEYARMVSGEGWLGAGLPPLDLTVIKAANYTHATPYILPIPPSPNLPNQRSVYLYPHFCLMEGTVLSVGRGTASQFQVYGHPLMQLGTYRFTPEPMPGARQPKLEGRECRGFIFTDIEPATLFAERRFNLSYLWQAYNELKGKVEVIDRPDFFDKLAGSDRLRKQLAAGTPEADIRASWAADLEKFRAVREKYLLYP